MKHEQEPGGLLRAFLGPKVQCPPPSLLRNAPAGLNEPLHQRHLALKLRQLGLLVQGALGLGLGQALVGLSERSVGLVIVLVFIDLHLSRQDYQDPGAKDPPESPQPASRGCTWAQAS